MPIRAPAERFKELLREAEFEIVQMRVGGLHALLASRAPRKLGEAPAKGQLGLPCASPSSNAEAAAAG